MTQKPKIQYIGQFYVYGSEAKAPAVKEKKKPKTILPQAKPLEVREISVEPVALGSIFVTVVLLIAMAVSAIQLKTSWQEYKVMADYADRLSAANVQLLEAYRSSYDLEEIESQAQALGMVKAEEATNISIRLTQVPVQAEETWWDDVVWFFQGLFA